MAKIIVVTSGKGGVGKTTSAAAIGAGLALRGKKTVVIDFDVGLRNLDLIMGCERRVVFDFINVINDGDRLQAGADQGQAGRQPVRPADLADPRQGRARPGGRREGAGRAARAVRLHHLRQPGRHRARRADGALLRRRGGDRHQPRGLLGPRQRPDHRHPQQQDAPRREGRGAGQAASPADPLRPGAGREGRDAQGRGRARDPVDPAARRDPAGRRGADRPPTSACRWSSTRSPRPARPTPTRSRG